MNRRSIAEGSFTMVERCDCGSLYLTIGPLCLKLDVNALPELRETLSRAATALQLEKQMISVTAEPGGAAGRRETEGTEGEGRSDTRDDQGPPCDVN
jgi:hypothetical protein